MPLSPEGKAVLNEAVEMVKATHWVKGRYGIHKGASVVKYDYDANRYRENVQPKLQACTVGMIAYVARKQAGQLTDTESDFHIDNAPDVAREVVVAVGNSVAGHCVGNVWEAESAVIDWNDDFECDREKVIAELESLL